MRGWVSPIVGGGGGVDGQGGVLIKTKEKCITLRGIDVMYVVLIDRRPETGSGENLTNVQINTVRSELLLQCSLATLYEDDMSPFLLRLSRQSLSTIKDSPK